MRTSNQSDIIDQRLSIFISFSFLLVAINRVASLPFAVNFQSLISIGQWIVYFCILYSNLKNIYNRAKQVFIKSYIVFVILYLWSCLFSTLRGMPIDLIVSHEIVWTILYFIPVGIATFCIKNYQYLYNSLYNVSYLISVLCIFYSVYRLYINPFGNSYDMAFGYILLVPALFHICEFKKEHNIFILLYLFIEIFFLLIFGSRGVVIGIVSYLFLDMYFKFKTRLSKLKILIPIIVIGIIYIELPKINDYLESQNIYSRTLIKLGSGDEDDETYGRSNHWDVGMDLVKEQPIIGYGLGGYYYDFYYALSKKHPDELYAFDIESGIWVKGSANVSGCHSGFIDMMLFFGVILGLPLALWILFSIIKIKKVDDPFIFNLTLIFYCSYILGNMIVGGGIFTKPGCAIFLYLMYKIQKRTISTKNVYNIKNIF